MDFRPQLNALARAAENPMLLEFELYPPRNPLLIQNGFETGTFSRAGVLLCELGFIIQTRVAWERGIVVDLMVKHRSTSQALNLKG